MRGTLTSSLCAAALTLVPAACSEDHDPTSSAESTEVSGPTTTSAAPIWSGPDLDRGTDVQPGAALPTDPGTITWDDPSDATVDFVDVTGVRFGREDPRWYFDLEGTPPSVTDLEPGTILTYGVAFDTNADGVADYTAGLNNDAPARDDGSYRTWVTELATGQTYEQIGPSYGYPLEFNGYGATPNEMGLWFLGHQGDGRSVPAALNPQTAPFCLWTSLTRDGVLVANDYAPDTGWLSGR